MNTLSEKTIHCPYCGEAIQVLLDPEDVGEEYIEDCQVCCRPIIFLVSVYGEGEGDELSVWVRSENDNF